MPNQTQLAASALYANLMTEIKIRITAINTGTLNQLPVPPPIVKEFCFLQVRMICELIALGCLVAHGDISATKSSKLQKAWEADKIIEALEALHPDFFPVPVVQGIGAPLSSGAKHHTIEPRVPHPLPKAEFLKLYHKCGETLHRGSIKKLLSQKTPIQVHYPDITAVGAKATRPAQRPHSGNAWRQNVFYLRSFQRGRQHECPGRYRRDGDTATRRASFFRSFPTKVT